MRPPLQRQAEAARPVQGVLGAPPLPARTHQRRLEDRIEAFARWLAALLGWRRWLAAGVAGAVSVLAMAPFFLWPVLLVTLPTLIWLIEASPRGAAPSAGARLDLDRRRLASAAAVGWCFGYGYHLFGLYWIREAFLVTGGKLAWLWPLGALGLPACLALYHGLAAAAAAALPGSGLRRVVALAVALGATEWLRGHLLTGFPWNVIGLALTYPLTLMQSSAVLGIYGLTIVTVLALGGPGIVLAASANSPGSRASARIRATALLVGPLAVMLGYGTFRLAAPPPAMVEGVRIRLVQPSIPQRDKWLAEKQPEILARHIELTRRGTDGREDNLAGITLVIWPEAAVPFLPLQQPRVLAAIGEALPDDVHLLAGILRTESPSTPVGSDAPGPQGRMRVFNSLAAFDDSGQPIAMYDKTHLVPFGEYLPLQGVLESIGLQALTRQRGGFAIGPMPRPLIYLPGLPPLGPLICYEAVFPGTGQQSRGRPGFLVNATNDGWFGNSAGPRQHLHQARLRSVEEGLPLMRVANNGITAAFDAYGRELARVDLDVAGTIDTGLPSAIEAPLYARFGDLPFALLLCSGVLALIVFGPHRQRVR